MTTYGTTYTNPATGAGAASTDVGGFGAGLPAGCIVMWAGTIATIPAGWVICDGNNGTPNLLAKFIKGVATAATNPGGTGGAASVNYTPVGTNNAPAIAWPAGVPAAANESAHTHDGSTLVVGAPSATIATGSSGAVKPTATHIHSVTGNTGAGTAHSHAITWPAGVPTLAAAPAFTGTQASIATEPAYYALAFIMKT